MTKEEYLEQILPLIPELQGHFATVEENLSKLSSEKCTEKTFLQGTGSAMKHIDRISSKIGGLRPAPFECIEMDNILHQFVNHLANIALLFSSIGLRSRDAGPRLQLSLQNSKGACQSLQKLLYEMEKVQ